MKVARMFRLRDLRGEATETEKVVSELLLPKSGGACVIAITWPNQKVGHEQDMPKR
jgi:hypothetical protein